MRLYHAFENWLEQRQRFKQSAKPLHRQIVAVKSPSLKPFIAALYKNSDHLLIVASKDTLNDPTLLVNTGLDKASAQLLAEEQYRSVLGTQVADVIFDLRSGINLDALIAISGLIKPGGVLTLLLPIQAQHAPLYNNTGILYSYAGNDNNRKHTSYFIPYFLDKLSQSKTVLFSEDHFPTSFIPLTPKTVHIQPTPEQETKLVTRAFTLSRRQKDILAQATAETAKVHVILGKRGRGKSSLLAHICSELCRMRGKDLASRACKTTIIVTAPTKSQLASFYQHLSTQAANNITFIAPDTVTQTLEQVQIETGIAALLVIDEVASIAPELVKSMLQYCKQVFIAGTTDGYEGSGSGFLLRLMPYLHERHSSKVYELTESFRWYRHDPIETFFEDLLTLNQSNNFKPSASAKKQHISHMPADTALTASNKHSQILQPTLREVSKQALIEDSKLFHEVCTLLRTAHYQTQANDIVRLLDAPEQRLIIATDANLQTLYGVCLLIEEGGSCLADVAQDISLGRRRVQGHLSPQTIALQLLKSDICEQRCLRINRIAVNDGFRKRGVARALLAFCENTAKSEGFNYLSTSFGYTLSLYAFWVKNQYDLVKIGSRVDTSSGTNSALMLKTIDFPEYAIYLANLKMRLSMDIGYFEQFLDNWPRQQHPIQAIPANFMPLNNTRDLSHFSYMLDLFINGNVNLNLVAPYLWKYIRSLNSEDLQCDEAKIKKQLIIYFKDYHKKGTHKADKNALHEKIRNLIRSFTTK